MAHLDCLFPSYLSFVSYLFTLGLLTFLLLQLACVLILTSAILISILKPLYLLFPQPRIFFPQILAGF